ncbi:MAG: hypothetical protein JWR21_4081 [Herminiimonas sp.]|nr:hypothetical protein [Herminiimonas sp.]
MKNLALVTVVAALAAPAAWAETIYANGPSGAHYANGSLEPVCSQTSDPQGIGCTGTIIGGVGNTNAVALLSASYSGTVQCRNHGNQIVEVKSQTTESTSSGTLRPSKNGQLQVPPLSTTAPTARELESKAVCPNGNWTKELLGSVSLVNFTYTCTFALFTQPFISIVGP